MANKLVINVTTGIATRVDTTPEEDDKRSTDAQAYISKRTEKDQNRSDILKKLNITEEEWKLLKTL